MKLAVCSGAGLLGIWGLQSVCLPRPVGWCLHPLPSGDRLNEDGLDCISMRFSAISYKEIDESFPGGLVVKNPPTNAGARVQSLVREDPTCRGATEPRATSIELCSRAPETQLLKPTCLLRVHALQQEKSAQ